MTTRASTGAPPRSFSTKRLTLAYRARKPWSSTRSCQIATALRPRASASLISSRYGSQALDRDDPLGAGGHGAVPESVDTCSVVAGFDRPESVDTSPEMAGFDAS